MKTVLQIILEDNQDIFASLKDQSKSEISEEEMRNQVLTQIKENKIAEMTANAFNQMLQSVIHTDNNLEQKVYVSSVDCYSNNDSTSLLDSWKVESV